MYTEWMQVFEQLPAEECQKLLLAVISYAQTGNAPVLDGMAAMAFTFIRGQLDRDAKKWEEVKKQRSEAGKKGATARWEGKSNSSDKQNMANDGKAIQAMANDGKGIQAMANDSKAWQTMAKMAVDVNADVDEDVNEDVNGDVNGNDNVNENDNHTDNSQFSILNS